jgi:hypothetical protein
MTRRVAVLGIGLWLAGCAAPACKPKVVYETKVVTEEVERYVPASAAPPAHEALLSAYADSLAAERALFLQLQSKPKLINKLVPLDKAAFEAFVPIQNPAHRATTGEIAKAALAESSLQNGINKIEGLMK